PQQPQVQVLNEAQFLQLLQQMGVESTSTGFSMERLLPDGMDGTQLPDQRQPSRPARAPPQTRAPTRTATPFQDAPVAAPSGTPTTTPATQQAATEVTSSGSGLSPSEAQAYLDAHNKRREGRRRRTAPHRHRQY